MHEHHLVNLHNKFEDHRQHLLRGHQEIHRIFDKKGYEQIRLLKVPLKKIKYCQDLVNTIIDQEWKYTLTLFFSSFVVSWVFFAILWYLIANAHGDLLFNKIGERMGEGSMPCVHGVTSVLEIFIYSVETQTTIGFGEKYPTEECPESIFLYVTQIIVSTAIEGAMVGIIYAKTAKPLNPTYQIKFSDKAVVCFRDGQLCLMIRIHDQREQHVVGNKIRMFFISNKSTIEGERFKDFHELELFCNGKNILLWPEIVVHLIDEKSPFYEFKPADFQNKNYELLVSLTGTSASTGQLTEGRTSYMPNEVFRGQRFINIISFNPNTGKYIIDNNNFNSTESEITTE